MTGSNDSSPESHDWEPGGTLWNPLTLDTHLTSQTGVSETPRKRRRSNARRSCQVPGCTDSLVDCKPYFRRHSVCPEHSVARVVMLNGTEARFCQQCAKFERLTAFDGGNRSCRLRLSRRNIAKLKASPGKTRDVRVTMDADSQTPAFSGDHLAARKHELKAARRGSSNDEERYDVAGGSAVNPSGMQTSPSGSKSDGPDTVHCPDAFQTSSRSWDVAEDAERLGVLGQGSVQRGRDETQAGAGSAGGATRTVASDGETSTKSWIKPISPWMDPSKDESTDCVDAALAPFTAALRLERQSGELHLQASQTCIIEGGTADFQLDTTKTARECPPGRVAPRLETSFQELQSSAHNNKAPTATAATSSHLRNLPTANSYDQNLVRDGGGAGTSVGVPLAMHALSTRPGLRQPERTALESLLGLTPGSAVLSRGLDSRVLDAQLQDILQEVMREGGKVASGQDGCIPGNQLAGGLGESEGRGSALLAGSTALAGARAYLGLPEMSQPLSVQEYMGSAGSSGGAWDGVAGDAGAHVCLGPPPDLFGGGCGSEDRCGLAAAVMASRTKAMNSLQWQLLQEKQLQIQRLQQQMQEHQQLLVQKNQEAQQIQRRMQLQELMQQRQDLQQQAQRGGAQGSLLPSLGSSSGPQDASRSDVLGPTRGATRAVQQVSDTATAADSRILAGFVPRDGPAGLGGMQASSGLAAAPGAGNQSLAATTAAGGWGNTPPLGAGVSGGSHGVPANWAAWAGTGGDMRYDSMAPRDGEKAWDDYRSEYEAVRMSYKFTDCTPYDMHPCTQRLLQRVAADGSGGVSVAGPAAVRPGCVRIVTTVTFPVSGEHFDAQKPAVMASLRELAMSNETGVVLQAGMQVVAVDHTGCEVPRSGLTPPVLERVFPLALGMGSSESLLQVYGNGLASPNIEFWARMQGVHYKLGLQPPAPSPQHNGGDGEVVLRLPPLLAPGLLLLEACVGSGVTAQLSDWLAVVVVPSRTAVEQLNSLVGRMSPASLRRMLVDLGSLLDARPLLSQPVNGLVPVVVPTNGHGSSSTCSKATWLSTTLEQELGEAAGETGSAAPTEAGVWELVSQAGTDSTLTSRRGGDPSIKAATDRSPCLLGLPTGNAFVAELAAALAASSRMPSPENSASGAVVASGPDPTELSAYVTATGTTGTEVEARVQRVRRLLGCADLSEVLTNADDETVVERLLGPQAARVLLGRVVSVTTYFAERALPDVALLALSALTDLHRSYPDLLRASLAPRPRRGGPCLMHAVVRSRSVALLLAAATCGDALGEHVSLAWPGPSGVTPLHLVALLGAPQLLAGLQLVVPYTGHLMDTLTDDNGITPGDIVRQLHPSSYNIIQRLHRQPSPLQPPSILPYATWPLPSDPHPMTGHCGSAGQGTIAGCADFSLSAHLTHHPAAITDMRGGGAGQFEVGVEDIAPICIKPAEGMETTVAETEQPAEGSFGAALPSGGEAGLGDELGDDGGRRWVPEERLVVILMVTVAFLAVILQRYSSCHVSLIFLEH